MIFFYFLILISKVLFSLMEPFDCQIKRQLLPIFNEWQYWKMGDQGRKGVKSRWLVQTWHEKFNLVQFFKSYLFHPLNFDIKFYFYCFLVHGLWEVREKESITRFERKEIKSSLTLILTTKMVNIGVQFEV